MNPHPRTRTLVSVAAAGLLAASVAGIASVPAQAADKTVLKVVGTFDVSDSDLMSKVIEPDFEKANPTIDLQYTPQGTGAAITSAKSGSFSALLVHAASLENQFVADGYSAEQYGRSLFWGDYVLLGPKGDPAGVTSSGQPSNDTAAAFEKIAQAGTAKKAVLVSRGGTPGTTVQEHAIWALTTGVPTCTVSAKQGGGKLPVTDAANGTACSDTEASRPRPDWYTLTGASQADNINLANACTTGQGNGSNCYTFTDRGTFANLQSKGLANNLQIVARDNSASARGGADLLVNSFHGYAIKPGSVPGDQVNLAAATTFLNFITSPGEQKKIGTYLGTGRAAGFIPSAAPLVSTSVPPKVVTSGSTVTVTGVLDNATPGTPVLAGESVELYATVKGGTTRRVATATTDGTGKYVLKAAQAQSTKYSVRTPQITKVENAALDPDFGDILQPTDTGLGVTTVNSATKVTSRTRGTGSRRHYITINGTVSPKVVGSGGRITVVRTKAGGKPETASLRAIPAGATTFSRTLYFPTGTWYYAVKYSNDGVVNSSGTPTYSTVVPK